MRLAAFGPPGAGKGTQTIRIAKHFKIAHISTGDLLREQIRLKTPLGISIQEAMNNGRLVSDEIVTNMVISLFHDFDKSGFIFDGFPRNLNQAEAFDEYLKKLGIGLDKVITIDVPDEVIIGRISGRLTCPDCGRTFHIKYSLPEKEGICDECGASLIHRKDDSAESVGNRLKAYHEAMQPVLEFYKKQGILEIVDGNGNIDEITERILALFKV